MAGRGPMLDLDLVQMGGGEPDVDVVGGGDSSPFAAPIGGIFPSTSSRRLSKLHKENECMTQIEPIVLTQRWTISNFASLIKLSLPGNCLRSTIFRDPAQPDACWQLCMYPGGKREENANHVSLFLKMSATTQNKEVCVKAEYRFFFIDDNEQPRFTNVNIGDFHAKPPKGGHSWGLRNIPKQKVLNSIRSDNSLVISCVIELMPDVSRIPCKKMNSQSGPLTEMAFVTKTHVNNELRMLESGDRSDMVICVGDTGRKFNVHRYKLYSQSDVLRRMLENEDMQESKSGELTIRDFSESAVQAMLEFIYSGSINADISIDEYAETMELADKYNVSSLKTLCEDQLVEKVSYKTAVEVLVLAERFNTQSLLDHCIELMVSHKAKVMETSNWRSLREHNPRLANTVLEHMVASDQQSTPPVKRSRL